MFRDPPKDAVSSLNMRGEGKIKESLFRRRVVVFYVAINIGSSYVVSLRSLTRQALYV